MNITRRFTSVGIELLYATMCYPCFLIAKQLSQAKIEIKFCEASDVS